MASRDERASVIVTSTRQFGRWGEAFRDAVVAAAMIDRLVHHGQVVSLKGDSYRLKDRDLGRVPAEMAPEARIVPMRRKRTAAGGGVTAASFLHPPQPPVAARAGRGVGPHPVVELEDSQGDPR